MDKKPLVAIVGFKGTQRSYKTEAFRLYISLVYARVKALINSYYKCDWFFISPIHGILHPEEKIEPYSLSTYSSDVWNKLCRGAVSSREWVSKVNYQLYLLSFKYENFVTFAEKDLVRPFKILRESNKNKGKCYRGLYKFCKMKIPFAERWQLCNNESLIYKHPYLTN